MPDSQWIAPTIDRSQHTVLVVDDNPATRYATSRVLRAAGFPVVEAETGAQALAQAGTGIAAVVLDVHLPDMDGFEVCRSLRANARTALTPVVHLSAAYVQNEHRVAGLNAGADAYMVHPAEPALLLATLQALIRARTAEDELRRSETRFRAIYDQAPVAMMLIDTAGRFADVNPAAQALFQRGRDELVGVSVTALAPPAWRAFAQRLFEHGPGQETMPWQGEFPMLRADGGEMLLSWNLSDHEEPGVRIGIARDLTERIDFERRRQELLEREQAARVLAERQSRTKDDFVAVLSHELRTPLTLITGWVHMLRRAKPAPTPDGLARGLDAIERGAKAQGRIISDILDVSRIASGKLRLHREWARPLELTQTSLDALRDQAQLKNIALVIESAGVDEAAWLDVTRFQQIVWNLVTNAIKFSQHGGAVTVRLARRGDELLLEVQDQGIGIAPEFLPYMFERFTQSDTPGNRAHGGLGLGMSIVKHLVELHGGTVAAASAGANQGATMTVRMNVAHQESAAPAPAGGGDAGNGQRLLQGKDILVVEDNADTREMLNVVLADEGAHVRLAGDYDSAMAQLDTAWPQLLVSDIGLPGRDGYELIAAIRALERQQGRPPIRAVALTAFARPQDRERALLAGFDQHLDKPLQPHVLVSALSG
ncbi:response regulator [Acidovorax sp. MR-S7]|uniref:hybrid sensor histidine kinase/response regulator n=1 Tax=Acidovorax sp. MR-S7 TaxID=1268622 RepID=UPI00036C3C3E|nr:response regulator [Acidovorax sp. MR-S7]GAD21279.1 signal transduction histidine kinase [Acidovorax sp. MR-S7]